jgi:hypothetical protein
MVLNHGERARTRASRRAMCHTGDGTGGATTPGPTTTLTHDDTGSRSPLPDFTQETTALPSSPSLLSRDEVGAPRPPTPPHDHAVDDVEAEAIGGSYDGASDGFHIVVGRGGQLPHKHCNTAFHTDATTATPQNNLNPFEILRNTSSGAESSPCQTPQALAPTEADTLRDIVEDGFNDIFGEMEDSPANDTHFRLREIFREAAHHVDSILNDVKGEFTRLTGIESRLDTIESRLDLILQRLPQPTDGWSDRIVPLEQTVKESKEIWPVLDDVRHWQLSKIRGDITKLENGLEVLKLEFCQGLDDVNIRVDGILERMGTHVPSNRDMTTSDSPRQGVGLSPAVNLGCNETVHPNNNAQ